MHLNVKEANTSSKGNRRIDGMIDMIQTLAAKGHADAVKGTVIVLRTRKTLPEYGKLSKKKIDDLFRPDNRGN